MKRRSEEDGVDYPSNSRYKQASNPYLAYSKKRESEVFYRRRKKGSRGLLFHNEEEQEEEQQQYSYPQSRIQQEEEFSSSSSFNNQKQQKEEIKTTDILLKIHNLDTPGMEWWDLVYLPKEVRFDSLSWNPETAPYDKLKTSNQKNTLYIEHPIPIQPTKQSTDSTEPLKFYQTKAEIKRIRRQNRQIMIQEKRDKIFLGLLPAPPPKVRISNLLRVLSTEHAADPSAIEAKVKEEMEQRERQHQARNLAKKLTPKEKLEKIRKRIQKDANSSIVNLAVFRITNMNLMQESLAKKRISKISLTAKKLMLSGRIITVAAPTSIPTLIIVEGGPKSIRKFTRLILKRINWKAKTILEAAIGMVEEEDDEEESNEDDKMEEEEEEEGENDGKIEEGGEVIKVERKGISASSSLVWRGSSGRREFEGFRSENIESALDGKQMLQSKNLGHLWDITIDNQTEELNTLEEII